LLFNLPHTFSTADIESASVSPLVCCCSGSWPSLLCWYLPPLHPRRASTSGLKNHSKRKQNFNTSTNNWPTVVISARRGIRTFAHVAAMEIHRTAVRFVYLEVISCTWCYLQTRESGIFPALAHFSYGLQIIPARWNSVKLGGKEISGVISLPFLCIKKT